MQKFTKCGEVVRTKGFNTKKYSCLLSSKYVFPVNHFFSVYKMICFSVLQWLVTFFLQVKMLEALQDIEIASKLVGFDADGNESIDEKYEKLQCHMSPLSRDSEDFRLIEKYLHTTHAPTHTVGSFFYLLFFFSFFFGLNFLHIFHLGCQ